MSFDSLNYTTPDTGSPVAVDTGSNGAKIQIVKLGSPTATEEALASAVDPIPVRLSDGSAYIATMPVSIAATITISGSVTANAGTNLNTSALALESGGNLATAATLLGTIDADTSTLATTDFALESGGNLAAIAAVDFMTGTDFSNVLGSSSLIIATQADNLVNTQDTIATSALLYAFDGSTWDRMLGDSINGLLVNLGGNNDVTVSSGSVTANAGTNLNTSTLALETGGNLQSAATSLTTVSAWDSSGRAAVSPISGQAGVQGGSGAVSATTQRVVLATDVALPAGTNAIGKLSANSGVDIGDVDVTSLPALAAGTNLIGRASASGETSTIYDGTTALTPKFAAIAAATSGNNTLVSAVVGKKIRVLSMTLVAGAAGNIYFTSNAGGTVIFGGSTNTINLAANGGFVLPYSPIGWLENSSANQDLVMNASSTGPFSGGLVYVEV